MTSIELTYACTMTPPRACRRALIPVAGLRIFDPGPVGEELIHLHTSKLAIDVPIRSIDTDIADTLPFQVGILKDL